MQIVVKPLIAKNYIIVPNDKELVQCSICYDKAVDLMACAGPCRQPFCLVCLSNINRRKNVCPSRCSKKLEGVPITEHKVSFECPYNKELCKPLQTVQEFKAHILQCQHMKENDKEEIKNKKEYKCIKGHQLTYLNQDRFQSLFIGQDFYQYTQKQYCVICHQQRISNAICLVCEPQKKNQFYCLECRSIPCGKVRCAFGHRLEIDDQIDDFEALCDFCGASILLFKKHCYEDSQCDFDICTRCHQTLPQQAVKLQYSGPVFRRRSSSSDSD